MPIVARLTIPLIDGVPRLARPPLPSRRSTRISTRADRRDAERTRTRAPLRFHCRAAARTSER